MKHTDRRTFLFATGGAVSSVALAGCLGDDDDGDNGGGGGGGGGADGFEIDPGTTIELDGHATGWEGVSPSAIDGEENPTLVLSEGEEYTMEWINADGVPHDLQIRDDGDDVVDDLETDQVSGTGESASLTFSASSEMVTYICSLHPASQVGDLVVE